FDAGLFKRHVRAQPRKGHQMLTVAASPRLRNIITNRRPYLCGFIKICRCEIFKRRRHHADYIESLSAESDRLADDVRISTEASTPKAVVDNGNDPRGGVVFFRAEFAPQRRFDAEQRKIIG